MRIGEIIEILKAEVLWVQDPDVEIHAACGSDLMSDVLAFVKEQGMMLTGLLNPQVVRTAEMMDMRLICFVRGKIPSPEIVELAKLRGISLITTQSRMFSACGKLFQAGLTGGEAAR